MPSLFTRIVRGEIPSYRIAEDDLYFAFLDIHPLREGHTLIIPKYETDRFFDLPEDLLSGILLFATPIAHAIEQAYPCNRCGISVIGLEVPHAHMHLVPIDTAEDLDFTRPKLRLTEEEFKSCQERILRYL